MSDTIKTVQDDLVFLRGLAEGGVAGIGRAGSALYGSAGLIYGLQCLGHYGQAVGVLRTPPAAALALAFVPTVIFLVLMTVVIVAERKRPAAGVASRAVSAAFTGVGLANLALALIFAIAARRHNDFHYWLFHPAVVFVLQGAAWYVFFALRKRAWMLLVAAGWLVSGVTLGLLIQSPADYLLVAGFSLFAWMMVPGFAMARRA